MDRVERDHAHDAAFLRRVLECSGEGIWVRDLDGSTLFANARTAELLGRTPEEMAATSVFDVLDEHGRAQYATHLKRFQLSGPLPVDVECVYLKPDGSPVRLVVNESVLRDEHGTAVGSVCRLVPDDRRQALLHQLSTSRAQLDEAQAIAKIASWELDLVTDRLDWSRQMYSIFGLDPLHHVPTVEGFLDRIWSVDRERVAAMLAEARAGSTDLSVDFRYVRPDGEVGWLRGLGRLLPAADGRYTRVGGTVQEITDLKETELQLLDSVILNTLMQVMAAAANESATLAEALSAIRPTLLAHDDWQRAVGFDVVTDPDGVRRLEPYRGVELGDVEPDEHERAVAERVLREGELVFEESVRPDTPSIGFPLRLSGEPFLVAVITACSPFERHSMLRSMIGQVADQLTRVAEREQAATELANARDAAMEASRLKSRFLATMSHEIRTPMNGVIGLNELLLRTELDSHQRRLAQGGQVAGQALLGLINDILDFSKIEAGELELESVEFEVRQVFGQVDAMLAATAHDKGIAMRIQVDPDVPERLVGDPTRLGQILSNLVSNAVKFTRAGEVLVHASVDECAGDHMSLRVTVSDTGIGISEPQMERLFEPFRQADASTTRTFGGTGLGLAIARQLVSALGGEMGVSSTVDEGSTFWFTSRFATAVGDTGPRRPRAATQQDDPHDRRGHVLVVEDNEINQLVAQGLLEALGYTADVVENGELAVEAVAATCYSAVLMDLQMPGMDGYAASRLIREREPAGYRVPIVAMTASAIEGERERCIAAGMDDFLTKPVTTARLESVLRTYAVPAAADAAEVPPVEVAPAVPALDPARIEELLALGERAVPLVERAIGNFVSGLPDVLVDLQTAVDRGDGAALRAAAHKLKGSALNLGASEVADVSRRLEELGDRDETAPAPPMIEELRGAGTRAAEALDAYRSDRLGVGG